MVELTQIFRVDTRGLTVSPVVQKGIGIGIRRRPHVHQSASYLADQAGWKNIARNHRAVEWIAQYDGLIRVRINALRHIPNALQRRGREGHRLLTRRNRAIPFITAEEECLVAPNGPADCAAVL